jgi:hypothetical protein
MTEVTTSTTDGKEVVGQITVGNDVIIGSLTAERSVVIPGWIVTHPDLSDRAVRLWGYMKGALNGSFTIPGTTHKSLALLLDVSERTAREAIYELRDAGALIAEHVVVNGRQMGNRYYLWPAKSEHVGVAASSQGGSQLPAVYSINNNTINTTNNTAEISASSETSSRKNAKNDYSEDFESLWQIYPRRINKSNSYKAFCSTLRRGVSLEELTLATRNYASERIGQEERYTLHGATFFGKGERWRDWLPKVEVPFILDAETEKVALIWDLYDLTGVWHPGERGLDNPAKHGYSRVRNTKGQLVDVSGIPYELDAQGARRQIGYWN